MRLCFEKYDVDKSGYLEYQEIRSLLLEMNMHKQFALHYQPVQAFEGYVIHVWRTFDKNMDGKISFEEFVHLYNSLVDR